MTQITVDMETITLIAKASAEAAAQEVSEKVREDVRREFERLEVRMTEKMDGYFGKLAPSQHVVQHDRIDRLLGTIDRMSENAFTSILSKLLWGLLVAGALGYLAWNKATGGTG